MINLLPPEEKEKLLVQKNKQLIIVLGNAVLISLVCLVLVLLSLKFYVLGYITYQRLVLDTNDKEYQTPELLSFKDLVQKYNGALIKVNHFYQKETSVSDALKVISNIQKPSTVSLTDIAIGRAQDDEHIIKVTISGISETRDGLLALKSNLGNNKEIKNIYFPPENWVKSKDVTFYFTFETNERN